MMFFDRLIKKIENLELVVRRMDVAQKNLFREATVKSVDYDNGVAIVEAQGIESAEVPWMQQAGDIVEWTPLAPDQRVVLISPNGDLKRAFILPGGFTDKTPAPHNKSAEKRVVIGGAVITHSAEGLFINVNGVTFSFTGSGFDQVGGEQTHDAKNVGSTHTHGGVERGGSSTDEPN